MHLAQRRLQPARPLAIQVAEPGIAKPVRRSAPVLLPQQGQRHVGPAQLPVHPRPVRHRPPIRRHVRHRREQQRFQPLVAQPVRQRPAQPRPTCPGHITIHRAQTEPQALRDHPLRQSLAQVQPQHFTYGPHRHSFTWHPDPLLLGRDKATLGGRLSAAPNPYALQRHRNHHAGVHDEPETTFRIKRKSCSRSTGFSVHDGPDYALESILRVLTGKCDSRTGARRIIIRNRRQPGCRA